MDYTIQEFCARHGACAQGVEWALAHCATMQEAWATCHTEGDLHGHCWRVWMACQPGVLSRADAAAWLTVLGAALPSEDVWADPVELAYWLHGAQYRYACGHTYDDAKVKMAAWLLAHAAPSFAREETVCPDPAA